MYYVCLYTYMYVYIYVYIYIMCVCVYRHMRETAVGTRRCGERGALVWGRLRRNSGLHTRQLCTRVQRGARGAGR